MPCAQLAEALRNELARAQERSAQRIVDAVAPYARFVKAEESRWASAHHELTAMGDRAASFLAQFGMPTASIR